ncbi:ATPase [Dyella jiangningensis]|nr:ATPase [Dyella jiangningensis]
MPWRSPKERDMRDAGASPYDGLSETEAKARLERDGPNALPGSEAKSLWLIARDVLLEPMFLMLLVAGGLYLALGDLAEAIFLLMSVLVIIGITLAQQRKTQRALEALRDLSAPQARVIRDGRNIPISSAAVVVDDLLSLREGDRIAADGLLVSGHLEVDESLLTGESVPVGKVPRAGDASVLAGTVVTKGRGLARVSATGAATAMGRIGRDLSETMEATSGLQKASTRIVRLFALAAVFCAISLWLINWLWDRHSLMDSLLSAIALAMAILPEEFPVILTVFLALGAWRIAKQNVLTRRMSAVEALGAITVLAVDKTGTLTCNRMRVAELSVHHQHHTIHEREVPSACRSLVRAALLATPADTNDPMEQAILSLAALLPARERDAASATPVREYGLDPGLLTMTRAFDLTGGQPYELFAKGAPETIIELCKLDVAEQQQLGDEVHAMAQRGLRVIAVATAAWSNAEWPVTQRAFSYRFAGLMGLMDPPRPEATAAMAECFNAGIRVIMMTGDHPTTARAIATQVGLSDAPVLMTGSEMDALTDPQLSDRLRGVDVCARVQPSQKLRLVKVLQGLGEIVGMTGDGVNDAPALKAANVGVAMGEHGTDVARGAAALVLLDDNFASLVVAVRQGRRIYDNITKATRFVVAVHVPVVALALVPSLLHWPILLMPVQIVLLQLLIDPACSIVFEATADSSAIMRRPPRAMGESPFHGANLGYGIAQGAGIAMILLFAYAYGSHLGLGDEQGRAAVFLGLLVAVLLLTLVNQNLTRPLWDKDLAKNPSLKVLMGGLAVILLAVAGIPPLRSLLGFAAIGAGTVAFELSILAVCTLWLELLRLLVRRTPLAAID